MTTRLKLERRTNAIAITTTDFPEGTSDLYERAFSEVNLARMPICGAAAGTRDRHAAGGVRGFVLDYRHRHRHALASPDRRLSRALRAA